MNCLSSLAISGICDGIKRQYVRIRSSIGVLMSAQDLIIFFFSLDRNVGMYWTHQFHCNITSLNCTTQPISLLSVFCCCPMSLRWIKFGNGAISFLFQFFLRIVCNLLEILRFVFSPFYFCVNVKFVSSIWVWEIVLGANVIMSTASVPSRVGNPFPQKKKTMKLFYHLLSDMKHQRVAVIALALGQAVNIHFLPCLFTLTATNDQQLFISIFPQNIIRIWCYRHWRIVHCFWCVLAWSMPNKYRACW